MFHYFATRADLDARPWDFQAEECSLRACVDRFNNRRYLAGNVLRSGGNGNGAGGPNNGGNGGANDLNEYGDPTNPLDPLNAGGAGLLAGSGSGGGGCEFGGNGGGQVYLPGLGGWDTEPVVLTEEFKAFYDVWLQQEVFEHPINWDKLITHVKF